MEPKRVEGLWKMLDGVIDSWVREQNPEQKKDMVVSASLLLGEKGMEGIGLWHIPEQVFEGIIMNIYTELHRTKEIASFEQGTKNGLVLTIYPSSLMEEAVEDGEDIGIMVVWKLKDD